VITVVDYGLGNLGSVENMLRHLGIAVHRSGDPEVVRNSSRLVLPGVGAFDRGMRNLRERGLVEALGEAVRSRGAPLLGICLGMQMLTERSEEGAETGLGWIEGGARRFAFPPGAPGLKVPHMGWNTVRATRASPLLQDLNEDARFYFVHSYYVAPVRAEDVILETTYGIAFASGVARDNVYGVQFHPEKSHRFGMRLLAAFARI